MASLKGKVCLVTGATRGIGKGIAMQLGEAGATVYITGRTLGTTDGTPGSLNATCAEVEKRGGRCIPIVCDHSDDQQVKQVFEQIEREQNGQLDCLVNNAYTAVQFLTNHLGQKFWELDAPKTWDLINCVGLRNHYICSSYAAAMMVKRGKGLMINISSVAGSSYQLNCAYGIGKAACDRMAADCAFELKPHGVAFVSLWPGAVRTETYAGALDRVGDWLQDAFQNGESTEYAGKGIVALLTDENVIAKTGRVLVTRELGDEYGFVDIDGKQPQSIRERVSLAN